MVQKWLDRLRGSSGSRTTSQSARSAREFIEPEEGEELILPNPHDEDEPMGIHRGAQAGSVQAGDGQRP